MGAITYIQLDDTPGNTPVSILKSFVSLPSVNPYSIETVGISSVLSYKGTTAGGFFGISYATNNDPSALPSKYREIIYGKLLLSSTSSSISWSNKIAGGSTLKFEATTQPHMVAVASKLFTAMAVNMPSSASAIGQVLISVFDTETGAQLIQKQAVLDTTYQLQNVQLVLQGGLTGSESSYNIFLVATLKLGQYILIQQIDNTITFSTNILRFHDALGAVNTFVDNLGNNHKTIVSPAIDSYYLVVNFKRFSQSTYIEPVILK
jgi:hypothetical protein